MMEDNPWREGKEHVKAISLQLGKVLSSPENPTPEGVMENIDDPREELLEAKEELRPEEAKAPSIELEKETLKDAKITKISFPSRLE
ncbi:troponin T, skeletal muscle-like [Gossypium australe]|uniref:Troponin T, skeletal muscle-like n=1 Tax=Gossypium australe TaxID=47621 RepID=A0A5B6WS69_9ROSI|nr:troponin T, skeletal muscle-like [Gossypium australe]